MAPAVPANPGRSSYNGFSWNPGIIFAVPVTENFKIKVRHEVEWEYDYTRGITCYNYRAAKASDSLEFKADKISHYVLSTDKVHLKMADGSSQDYRTGEKSLPFMLEKIEELAGTEDCRLATLYSAIKLTNFLRGVDSTSFKTVLFAPTNRAFEDLINTQVPSSFDLFGPDSVHYVRDLLSRLVYNIPGKFSEQLRNMIMQSGRELEPPIPVREGYLFITDRFPTYSILQTLSHLVLSEGTPDPEMELDNVFSFGRNR
jgi:hypothetical protein